MAAASHSPRRLAADSRCGSSRGGDSAQRGPPAGVGFRPARVKLHTRILLGLVLGFLAAVAAHALWPSSGAVAWLAQRVWNPVGQVSLRWMQMTVVPLVFASIVLGVAGIGSTRTLGRLGLLTLGFAIILGIDRLLDTARTTVNVAGDLSAALFVARHERARAAGGTP